MRRKPPEKGGSVKRDFSCYNNDLTWLCWEAVANASQQSNSLFSGKIQGMSSKSGRCATLDASIHKALRAKFPTHVTGKFSTRTGNVF